MVKTSVQSNDRLGAKVIESTIGKSRAGMGSFDSGQIGNTMVIGYFR